MKKLFFAGAAQRFVKFSKNIIFYDATLIPDIFWSQFRQHDNFPAIEAVKDIERHWPEPLTIIVYRRITIIPKKSADDLKNHLKHPS